MNDQYQSDVYVLKMGDFVLKFENEEGDVDVADLRKAAIELRENPDTKRNALRELKQLIADDDDLYLPLDDEVDVYLLAYLRACKFHVQSAFERLKYSCHFKLKFPEYFAQLEPATEEQVFRKNILTVLPQRDQHGRRLLLARIGKLWKPNECSLVQIMRGIFIIIGGAILEPRTQIAGAVLLLDMEGFNLQQHVWQFSPTFAKMILDWVQDCMPLRLKALHVIRQPYIFNMVFAMFKPFMREKLKHRIHLHGKDELSLLKHVDAKCLPTHYGGLMDVSLSQGVDQWTFLCHYNDKYQRTKEYGYTEKFKNQKTVPQQIKKD